MLPVEYLEWESRHEYLNGEVYAMTGGTLPHNSITRNMLSKVFVGWTE